MKDIEFEVKEKEEYTIIHFELEDAITPELMQNIELPRVNGTKGVILSGRGPLWFYCFLTHHYHPTKFVATYDPRLGGAVIVELHDSKYRLGDVIKMSVK